MSSQADTVPAVKFVTHIAVCPHCNQELRVAAKYVGQEVNCRFCSGPLRVETDEAAPTEGGQYQVVAIPLDCSLTTEGSVPHWPAAMQKELDRHAHNGYRFVRAFPAGEHLGIVFEKSPDRQ